MPKVMDLARMSYERAETFPNFETSGLSMQIRRTAVSVASHIAEAHGRLNDTAMRKGLGFARGALNEFETQVELAKNLSFLPSEAADTMLALASEVGKRINGLIGVLSTA